MFNEYIGKRNDTGQLVSGDLVYWSSKYSYIISTLIVDHFSPKADLFNCRSVMHKVKNTTLRRKVGLKDNKGKEIYTKDMPGGDWEGFYIDWCPECCSFALFDLDTKECLQCIGEWDWSGFVGEAKAGKVEIIGNILEVQNEKD